MKFGHPSLEKVWIISLFTNRFSISPSFSLDLTAVFHPQVMNRVPDSAFASSLHLIIFCMKTNQDGEFPSVPYFFNSRREKPLGRFTDKCQSLRLWKKSIELGVSKSG